MNTKETHIYSLQEVGTDDIRYIGKANKLNKRLTCHLSRGRKGLLSYCSRWIKGVLDRGSNIEIKEIDKVLLKDWEFWEKHYISLYKSWGFNLTNLTNGGIGTNWNNFTKERREEIRKYYKPIPPSRKGIPLTQEQLDKLAIARAKGHKTCRENRSEVNKKIIDSKRKNGTLQFKKHSIPDTKIGEICKSYIEGIPMYRIAEKLLVSGHTIKLILVKENIIK